MGKLDGKWALVTGSSRGIGQQIALGLAREGCDVVVHGRRAENAQATIAALEELIAIEKRPELLGEGAEMKLKIIREMMPEEFTVKGQKIEGDKGTLKVSVHKYDFIPRGKGEKIHRDVTYELEEYPEDKTEPRLEKHVAPALRRHMLNFLDAIAKRGRPVADIEEGYISSASCILANMAMQLGRTLTWDAEKGQIVGDEEANRLLRRPYREPWVHPDPGNV